MKITLIIYTLLTLLLPAFAFSNTNAKQKSEDFQNQADETKQIPAQENKEIAPSSQGKLLYENHCRKCHESNIHIRQNNKAKNIEDVKSWVVKWQEYEKLDWDKNAINAVTEYLVKQYYKFK